MLRRVARHASHAYFNSARDQDGRSYGEKIDFRDCIGEYALAKIHRSMAAVTALLCMAGIVARLVATPRVFGHKSQRLMAVLRMNAT